VTTALCSISRDSGRHLTTRAASGGREFRETIYLRGAI